ncbi:MAG: hypothetical protein WBD59_22330, partial [Candidatus Sulfotelmatobacter sp.]
MKAWVLLVLVVVVLAPVLVAAQNKPSRAKNRKDAQAAPPPAPISVNCNCASQTDASQNKPQGWHKLVTWPEGIATWALIVTLVGIFWQASVSGKAAKAAARNIKLYINKERARLRVEIKPLNLPAKPDPGYAVDFTVNIYGQTDAFITDSRCVAAICPQQSINYPEPGDAVMFPIHALPPVVVAKTEPVSCWAYLAAADDNFTITE